MLLHLTNEMATLGRPNSDEMVPTPPSYLISSDGSKADQDMRVYHIHSPFSLISPPPPFCLSPGADSSSQSQFSVSPRPPSMFVSYETELRRSPGLTTCVSCQTRVTTQVTYCVGRYAWLMCLLFVLCGCVFGCCLIPFFLKHFKDVYHTCPRCRLVLHVHKKTCC